MSRPPKATITPDTGTPAIRAERPEFVHSLKRGLSVIKSFDQTHSRMTLSEVAERTSLTRAGARRFLLTLHELGYVDYDQKYFWLRPAVLELGFAYLSSLGLGRIARPVLGRLTEELGEASSVSVLDGKDVVYVARVETRRPFFSVEVGGRVPAHCAATGQVLLAALAEDALAAWLVKSDLVARSPRSITDKQKLHARLSQIKSQGYAIVNGEVEVGVRSLAVPILDASRRTIAALNVGTLSARVTAKDMKEKYLEPIRRAAQEIQDGVV
jgi:IclR family pca regulon transcriptional regulator